MLEDIHKKFIDIYLQTNSVEQAAMGIGVKKDDALKAGIDLLNNPEIQKALTVRAKEFETAYSTLKLTKERLINLMMTQYEKANRLGRTKEAVEILTKIAEAQGIDFKTLKLDPVNFIINNLSKDKI